MDELFQIPALGEANTIEEINGQVSIIGEAITRCEKMLQHLVIGNFAGGGMSSLGGNSSDARDVDYLMTKHLELLSMRSDLEKKRKHLMEDAKNH